MILDIKTAQRLEMDIGRELEWLTDRLTAIYGNFKSADEASSFTFDQITYSLGYADKLSRVRKFINDEIDSYKSSSGINKILSEIEYEKYSLDVIESIIKIRPPTICVRSTVSYTNGLNDRHRDVFSHQHRCIHRTIQRLEDKCEDLIKAGTITISDKHEAILAKHGFLDWCK